MTGLIYSPHFRRIEPLLVSGTLACYAACVLAVAGWLRGVDDPMVRYALAFIVVQIAIQAGLILGLVVSKDLRSRRDRARAARRRSLEELLARPDSSRETLEMAAEWPDDFLSVVENAMHALAGSARRRIAELLEASAPYRQLLIEAAGASPGPVIRAVNLLGRLENPGARAAVGRCLKHRAEAVRRAARKAIVIGGEEDARRQVLEGVCSLPFWERIILFQLVPADSMLHDFLAKGLASDDDERILVALEFVLTRQRLLLFPVPVKLAQSRNVEVRIKFFRALPFLRLEEEVDSVLEPGLHDPDWRVRALAARACGYLRAEALVWRLLEMCASFDDPAEAGHAARALAALGGEGWDRLQEVVASGRGTGHRIAAEVIERRMLGGREAPR
ncbi:MAG TPA: HEAT repeat domain-containing protein [Bryobacteraceae bacterium]|nr:exported hypothetical protein [Candidatus Sulfopaludibacter sp. SbA4]HYW46350.1 HEAT repeat domain-containing protein [Bryobacteraceae bacterium]